MISYILVSVLGLIVMISLCFVVTRTIFFVARFGLGKGIVMAMRAKPISFLIIITFVTLKFVWPEFILEVFHFGDALEHAPKAAAVKSYAASSPTPSLVYVKVPGHPGFYDCPGYYEYVMGSDGFLSIKWTSYVWSYKFGDITHERIRLEPKWFTKQQGYLGEVVSDVLVMPQSLLNLYMAKQE
jgi:hypothetical protein